MKKNWVYFVITVATIFGYSCHSDGFLFSTQLSETTASARGKSVKEILDKSRCDEEDYKVLCLTRHSMRGISFVNAQEIKLPSNITLPNPFIAWDEELSQAGAHLIQASAINDCVEAGFHELNLRKWKKKWEEIRVDFLYQRTFLTGNILKKRLKNPSIKLTAVINKEEPGEFYLYNSENYDSVSYAMTAGTFKTNVPSTPTNIDPAILQEKTGTFLNWLNLSINEQPFSGELPPVFIDGNFNSFYATDITIATDLMIMSAFPTPPLNKLFKNKKYYPFQKEVVESACDLLGYTLPNLYSTQFVVYNSIPIIQYFDNMEFSNKGKIILTHDIRQLQLLKALHIEANPENIPFQSYVFIQAKDQVCIMYTAPKISKRGILRKRVFTTKLIWKGSLDEWNEKTENMYQYVDPIYPLYPVKEAFELKVE